MCVTPAVYKTPRATLKAAIPGRFFTRSPPFKKIAMGKGQTREIAWKLREKYRSKFPCYALLL